MFGLISLNGVIYFFRCTLISLLKRGKDVHTQETERESECVRERERKINEVYNQVKEKQWHKNE